MATAKDQHFPAHPEACGPRYAPLVLVVLAMTVGILLDASWSWPFPVWWWLSLLLAAAWLFVWRRSQTKMASVILLAAVAATCGCWHHCCWSLFWHDDLGRFARLGDRPVAVELVAREHPRLLPAEPFNPLRSLPSEEVTRLDVQVARVRQGSQWEAASGRATLLVRGEVPGLRAGDRFRLFGELAAPRPAGNAGEIDRAWYARAARKRAFLHASFPECVTVLEPASGWQPAGWLDDLRFAGDRLLWQHLSHERTGLAAALLLGARENLEDEQIEAFVTTGTMHLLAISGLHVGMLAAGLFLALRLGLLPRRWALPAVALLVLGYALLTESRPPVLRATLLVWMICGAMLLRRRALGFNTLAAAAIVVLAINPAELFRTGTQLSFLAVGAMVAFAPWLRQWTEQDALAQLTEQALPLPLRLLRGCRRWTFRMLLVSLVVWGVTAPLVMSRFHLVSPLAVLLNIILWLPVGCALLCGFGVLACGAWLPPLASLCGWMCDTSLALIEWVVQTAAESPLSHAWVCGPPAWWLAGFYVALAIWVAGLRCWVPLRWAATLLVAWAAIGMLASWRTAPRQLECTFLSVGHGLSTLVELPDGRVLLYDAGQLGPPGSVARTVSGHLWSRGITHLDAVVLSHSDVDHYNAIPELLKRFSVGVIYLSPEFHHDQGRAAQTVLAAVAQSGVPVKYLRKGDRLLAGTGCDARVLHPAGSGGIGVSDNSNSIVLMLEYGGRRVLLTGDLEPPGLYQVTFTEPLDCDVLLAPHHGSPTSDPWALAKWSTPEWAIISRGARPGAEKTAEVYSQTGARVLDTATVGAVHVIVTKARVDVETFRRP